MASHSSTLAWKIPWMEEPGRLQSMGSLESDTPERLPFHFSLSCIGEGNGNPLQCSCLENPRDGEAWWAAVYGVAQSRTQLKQLSSSSMLCTHVKNIMLIQLKLSWLHRWSDKGKNQVITYERRNCLDFIKIKMVKSSRKRTTFCLDGGCLSKSPTFASKRWSYWWTFCGLLKTNVLFKVLNTFM